MRSERTAKGIVRLLAGLAALTVAGCASMLLQEPTSEFSSAAYRPYQKLLDLYPPTSKIAVAVYRYDDKTGQFKPNETSQTLSRAVTQGAASILVQALQNAGRGSWFTIVERENLKNLLTERKIIAQMRKQYLSAEGAKLAPIGPMLYAGIILEGGIVGYDSNTVTGGAGARYLGIGGNVEYRQDTVTVYLRAISTKNGAILKSVMTTKNIFSFLIRADVFKFIDFAKLLEVETGYTNNEPGMFALKKAIEKAVYLMVMEGAGDKMWSFRDAEEGKKALLAYREEEYDERAPASQPATKQAAAKTEPKSVAPKSAAPKSKAPKPAGAKAAPTKPAATAATKPTAPNAVPAKRVAVAAPQDKTPPSAGKSKAQPMPGAKPPAAAKKANPAPDPVATAEGPYTIHLATAPSPRGIKTKWTALRRAHPDLFQGVSAGIDRGKAGPAKGKAYRLVAGRFASARDAGHFCARAKKRDLSCDIVRAPAEEPSRLPAKMQITSAPAQSSAPKPAGSAGTRTLAAPQIKAADKAVPKSATDDVRAPAEEPPRLPAKMQIASASAQSSATKPAGSAGTRTLAAPKIKATDKVIPKPATGDVEASAKNGAEPDKSDASLASAIAAIKIPKRRAHGDPQRLWTSVTKERPHPKHGTSAAYVVHLASMRTKKGAHTEWSRLSWAHPALFDDVRPAIAKKDLGQAKKSWYRLIAGPFGNIRAAADFCSRVKDRKLPCDVMRR